MDTGQRSIQAGSDYYYALRFSPAEKRDAICALHDVVTAISGVTRECSDPGVARLKLHWWQEELERTWRGEPQHPTSRQLHPYLSEYNLSIEYLQELIDGNLMDLDQYTYAKFSELALYCHRVSGTTQAMIAEILGYQDRQTSRFAADLGIALELIRLICDLRRSVQQGRCYIPREELQRLELTPEALLHGTHTPKITELLAQQSARARERLAGACGRLPAADQHTQVFGLILAAIAGARLDEVERAHYRVLEQRIDLTPIRKLWIAWKTARRHRR